MYLKLFLKYLPIALVILVALAVVTALIPGSEKWPSFVNYAIILLISFAGIVYLRRKYGPDGRS